jgi:hypothetical protein
MRKATFPTIAGNPPADGAQPSGIKGMMVIVVINVATDPRAPSILVCPIEGADVSFMTGTIPWKIKVEDSDTSGRAKSTIYKLVKDKRRYVRVIPPNAISQKKSSEP